MGKEVTLGEIFAKSNVDELNGYFDSEKFNKDVEQMSKAETEQLLGQIQSEIIKGGDYEELSSMRTIALNHIEKARSGVYADTAENRKLGRVGQQYGGKKQEDDKGGKGSDSKEEFVKYKMPSKKVREAAKKKEIAKTEQDTPQKIRDILRKKGYTPRRDGTWEHSDGMQAFPDKNGKWVTTTKMPGVRVSVESL